MTLNPEGNWVRQWRIKNSYTQSELAAELEITRQSIIKWEQSNTIDRVAHLALMALEQNPALQKIGGRKTMKLSKDID
ncbi:helix-turn-helix transcriptional regulator [Asticcacaulis machinosus]|uniref:Helix-turn-helix domain-containing protein n=1 Tax=Asticcacaulis machinosus TaxID=2984211 RepID=A0ABT5HM01_9CAUL|nr:helix-turn-helix domain-containing protein [Asticcacaulis machinosus]MDC7677033.1 helix-turn-helix domain-containing protein [Asticcacaulis machinosus]